MLASPLSPPPLPTHSWAHPSLSFLSSPISPQDPRRLGLATSALGVGLTATFIPRATKILFL